MRRLFNFLIKLSIYGLVFLLPVFWLPITNEAFEFNKQALLIGLTAVALMSWLAKMIVVQKKLVFRRTPLDLFVLLFMIVIAVSAALSLDPVSSWLGFYGQFTDSAAGFLAMGVLYFVITNNVGLGKKEGISASAGMTREDAGMTGGGDSRFRENDSGENENDSGESEKSSTLSIKAMLNCFLASSWVVVITSYLSFLGVFSKFSALPELMQANSFDPISLSTESLALWLAVVVSVLTGIVLNYPRAKKSQDEPEMLNESRVQKLRRKSKESGELKKASHYLLLVLAVILMVMTNFWIAWLSLGVVMVFLLIFAFSTRLFREKVNLLITPIVLVLLAILSVTGVLGQAKQYGPEFLKPKTVKEINLSHSAAGDISWQAFLENPIIGSGPGTFEVDFAKYKSEDFNKTQFWNVRFDKAPSQIMEMGATTGALGVLSYLLIVFVFALVSALAFRRFKRETGHKLSETEIGMMLALFLGWLALLLNQILYAGNTVILAMFWIFIAMTLVGWQKSKLIPAKKHSFSFKQVPEIGLVMNVVMLILVFAFVALVYMGGRFYVADVMYNQVLAAAQNKSVLKVEQGVKKLEQVVNAHPYRWTYRQTLSQAYLAGAQQEANKPEKKRDLDRLRAYATGAIQQARVATEISPNLVGPWQNLGSIYRDSRLIVNGSLPFAEKAFRKAADLAPHNPSFYQAICRMNLLQGKKKLDKALESCQKAVELKENYLDAHFQLSLVYEAKGDLESAVSQLQSLLDQLKGRSFRKGTAEANAISEIYFQLGRLHFNLNNIQEAVKAFEQSVVIRPNYANGHYALGITYEKKGQLKFALTQYEVTNKLINGSNKQLQKKIDKLRAKIQQQKQTQQEEEEKKEE